MNANSFSDRFTLVQATPPNLTGGSRKRQVAIPAKNSNIWSFRAQHRLCPSPFPWGQSPKSEKREEASLSQSSECKRTEVEKNSNVFLFSYFPEDPLMLLGEVERVGSKESSTKHTWPVAMWRCTL